MSRVVGIVGALGTVAGNLGIFLLTYLALDNASWFYGMWAFGAFLMTAFWTWGWLLIVAIGLELDE